MLPLLPTWYFAYTQVIAYAMTFCDIIRPHKLYVNALVMAPKKTVKKTAHVNFRINADSKELLSEKADELGIDLTKLFMQSAIEKLEKMGRLSAEEKEFLMRFV